MYSTYMYNLWHSWRRWSAPSPVATNVPCKSCQRWGFFLVTYLHRQMDVAGVCLLLEYYARPKPLRKKTILSEVGNFATICQSPCVCFPADAATKQGQARLIWEQWSASLRKVGLFFTGFVSVELLWRRALELTTVMMVGMSVVHACT